MQALRATLLGCSAALVALALSLLLAGTVVADCDGFIPPFRDHAGTAERIVIGTVTAIEPGTGDEVARSTRFSLRVTDVLRGPDATRLEVKDLPYLPCADHLVRAAKGERIALAIDAHGFEPPITFTTIAWLDAMDPVDPVNRITRAEVAALAASPPPPLTWIGIGGPRDWAPRPGYTLEVGDDAWRIDRDNGGGVTALPLTARTVVRVRRLADCVPVVRFVAVPGRDYYVRFAADGSARVEDWTDEGMDSGPALGDPSAPVCPALPDTSTAPQPFPAQPLVVVLFGASAAVVVLRRTGRRHATAQ